MKNKLLYKKNFEKYGFVIIRNFLKNDEIKKLKNDLINSYKKYLNKVINQKSINAIISNYEKINVGMNYILLLKNITNQTFLKKFRTD